MPELDDWTPSGVVPVTVVMLVSSFGPSACGSPCRTGICFSGSADMMATRIVHDPIAVDQGRRESGRTKGEREEKCQCGCVGPLVQRRCWAPAIMKASIATEDKKKTSRIGEVENKYLLAELDDKWRGAVNSE